MTHQTSNLSSLIYILTYFSLLNIFGGKNPSVSFHSSLLICFKKKTKTEVSTPKLSDFATCSLRKSSKLDGCFLSQNEHKYNYHQPCNKCWVPADGWHVFPLHTSPRVRKMALLTYTLLTRMFFIDTDNLTFHSGISLS